MMALLLAGLLLPGRRLGALGVKESREGWQRKDQTPGQRRLEGSSGGKWEDAPSREKPGEDLARGKGRDSGI